jgi:hypothetical protein
MSSARLVARLSTLAAALVLVVFTISLEGSHA